MEAAVLIGASARRHAVILHAQQRGLPQRQALVERMLRGLQAVGVRRQRRDPFRRGGSHVAAAAGGAQAALRFLRGTATR